MSNAVIEALLKDDAFIKSVGDRLAKGDTITQATGLLWYDLSPIIQLMYPFKELIPCISKLPRVPGDGGNAYHWMRVTGINSGNLSAGVSEGNRGARIAINSQPQTATYKTLGLESSVTFEAKLGGKNLHPDALGNAIQATLRSTMIQEEQSLILANASTPLAQCPTPSLAAGSTPVGTIPTGTVYVVCVALSGFGVQNYTPWNNSLSSGGVPGQVTKTNADGSVDTFGGGSGKPSAEASIAVTLGQSVTAVVAPTIGAVGYAWFLGSATGAEKLVAITTGTEIVFKSPASSTAQPLTNLQVASAYVDNSLNTLLPDGILSQIFGSVFGNAPGTYMATGIGAGLPSNVSLTGGGSIVYNAPVGNTGLTISGTNISEFDVVLETAYNVYKIGFDRILVSAADLAAFSGTMLSGGAASMFRIMFDAEAETGRIVAGRRVTSYLNKFFGNTLDIEIHPYLPPGTILFWSDRVPYELEGVTNLLEARVRQDYYQIEWPLRTRRYEYGVYVDEVFCCNFTPAFAAITGLNPTSGVQPY